MKGVVDDIFKVPEGTEENQKKISEVVLDALTKISTHHLSNTSLKPKPSAVCSN